MAAVAKTPEPDFAREVLPILSDKCFVCHGPDAEEDQRKLTHYEEAVRLRKGKQAINPETLKDSLLLERIAEKEDPMPPVDEKPLSDSEREILESWVIQAFNDNLPMDEFITWQLAGDLLPEPSLEQRVATGYVRMNPTINEGGSIPEEFQAKNNFDRVENLGTAFLGLSLQCARCHTHKYDPISQKEYFQLLAFFSNTAEKPLDGYKYDLPPVVKAPRDIADWKRFKQLK